MYSTQYLAEHFNFQTFTFGALKLAYHMLSALAYVIESMPILLAILWAWATWLAPGALLLVRATILTMVPVVGMWPVLTIPGLPLCLAVFALFSIVTWVVSK